MTNVEIANLIVSIIAVIVAIVALIKSSSATADSLRLSHGMSELELKQMIASSKNRVEDISIQMVPFASKKPKTREDERILEGYGLALKAAMEGNVNAYEEACAKYLDEKIDRERFRKTYNVEIRRLVQDPAHHEFFDGVRSPYKAILK